MPSVAVAHPEFSFTRIGGEEVICMHILEALQNDHDLTLFSYTDPDLDDLSRFAGTNVRTAKITTERTKLNRAPQFVSSINQASSGWFGLQRPFLAAMFSRRIARHENEFDLVISTSNELGLSNPSIQYVHFPRYHLSERNDEVGVKGPVSSTYDRACAALAGVDRDSIARHTLLTNSKWTAGVIKSIYGVKAEVVYPPVDTEGFIYNRSWDEREDGFITVGRLTPHKNALENIEIVRQLRKRGHDVHIHLVGPTATNNKDYVRKLRRTARKNDFVYLEGRVERDRMFKLIGQHRYGLHGKKYEHFGLAVAELVAGGTLPFIRNAGGQREIIGEQRELLYYTPDEAAKRIERVLKSRDAQDRLRAGLPDVNTKFDRERFITTIRSVVKDHLY